MRKHQKQLTVGLWIIAIVAVLATVSSSIHEYTDDFNNVYQSLRNFVTGENVYWEDYYGNNDPHYLYSPAATVILSPFALIGHYGMAHVVFSGINAACVVGAVILMFKYLGMRLDDWKLPTALLMMFVTANVQLSVAWGVNSC